MKRMFFVILLILAVPSLLSGCKSPDSSDALKARGDQSASTKTADVTLCFIAANSQQTGKLIETEKRFITYDDNNSLEKVTLEELFKGPTTTKAINIIPNGVQLEQLQCQGDILLVTLGINEDLKENLDMIQVKTTIAMTMLNIEGINKVGVYVDNIKWDQDGQPADLFDKSKIALDDTVEKSTEKQIVLYFPDTSLGKLRPELREITSEVGESLESAVIGELIKGPQISSGTHSFLSPYTHLLSAFVDSGVCYLNFSGDFLSDDKSELETKLTIYSIVDTICEIDGVDAAQIMIEGKTIEKYQAYTSDSYYKSNMDIIQFDK